MAADAPLNHLVLAATSVADDLGYVALADLSNALGTDAATSYRVIGGHMVTALVARWRLGAELYRETGDTDLRVPPVLVREHRLIERLSDLGYLKVAGNRFARTMTDVPVHLAEGDIARKAIVDVLVPAYTSRARENRRVTDQLVTTEVPGLALALQRAPIAMTLELHRLNGETLHAELSYPDEVAALVLKSFAAQVRDKSTDVVDIWRCLEVAFAAGVGTQEFENGVPATSAAIIRALFGSRNSAGMAALVAEGRLSDQGGDERFTRVQALMARVLGTG